MKNFLRCLADPSLIVGTMYGIAIASIPFWILAEGHIWYAWITWVGTFIVYEVVLVLSYKNM
jgi:hypothetical protein